MTSIIIINYNTFQLTVDCIRSVQDRTESEYEIVLVDNSSTECEAEKFTEWFPGIKLIKSKDNLGFSKGNNLGIRHAIGDYILLLNSDTLLINSAIDLALDKIKRDRSIGALSVQLVSSNGELQQCSHYWPSAVQLAGCSLKLHHLFDYFKPTQPDLQTGHYAQYLYGTFFLFPRSILEIFNDHKLPETFFMYGEDAEWSYYIRKSGYKLYYYPEAKILHYGGASSGNTANSEMKNFANEYKLRLIMKGRLYTAVYYLLLSAFYLSNFKKESFYNAKYVLSFLVKHWRERS